MSHAVAQECPQISPEALPATQNGLHGLELPLQGLDLSRNAPVLAELPSSDAVEEESKDTEPRILPGLLTIPAELRNIIYELAFAAERPRSILLVDACPPKKSLILTCRQAYFEARHIYNTAYRQYWTTNHFCINLLSYSTLDLSKVKFINERDLQRIERLTIWAKKEYWPPGRVAYATLQFVHLSGIWSRDVQHEHLNLPWPPTWHSNYIAVRRGGWGPRASDWCMQLDTVAECADVLRDEEEPMSLKEQVIVIMTKVGPRVEEVEVVAFVMGDR